MRCARGTWLPIHVGLAHDRACDALDLSLREQLEIGGDVGPKDLRVEFVGNPCASIRHFRVAYRGFIQAGCDCFARRTVVAELDSYLSESTVAYRIAWA